MKAAHPARRASRRAVTEVRLHPQALVVPAMSDLDWGAFLADVAANGIEQPLDVTPDGLVLDGRHRLRAATELGLADVPVRVVEPEDPVEYMVRSALQRRQLTQSQKAALAVKLLTLQNRGGAVATLPPPRGRVREIAGRVAGVSPRTMQDALTVASRDQALFEQVLAGNLPVHQARRQLDQRDRHATIRPAPGLPEGPFEVIYADPPWTLPSAEHHYPLMQTEQIAALPLPAADTAVLFLWEVTSLRVDAMAVIEAWRFTYKSELVWVKPSIGPGIYARNRHEKLLIATRGNYPAPEPTCRCDSVIEAPRGRHSEKPAIFYDLIERMYPHARGRLELFARGRPRPGWTAWGNQVEEVAA